MKNIQCRKALYFLFAVILFLSVKSYSAGENLQSASRSEFDVELSAIANFSNGNKDNLVIIKIFDHLLAIPNRYVLIASSKGEHEFNSISENSIGFIGVGRWPSEGYDEGFKRIEEMTTKIPVSVYRKETESGVHQILVRDADEYMFIQDQNAVLWEAILNHAVHR